MGSLFQSMLTLCAHCLQLMSSPSVWVCVCVSVYRRLCARTIQCIATRKSLISLVTKAAAPLLYFCECVCVAFLKMWSDSAVPGGAGAQLALRCLDKNIPHIMLPKERRKKRVKKNTE